MASSPSNFSLFSLVLLSFLLAAATAFPATSEFELVGRRNTYFRIYFHEIFLGPDNTTVVAVQKNLPNTFGDIDVFDVVLRAGPGKKSRAIGKAQGVGFHSSQKDQAMLIPLELVFTEGEFCDSSLTVIGRMAASGKADRAIVGGSGLFQFARGNVKSKLVTSSDAGLVAMFDVYVEYYDDVRVKASEMSYEF